MAHPPVGERWLARVLLGVWLVMTVAYAVMPPELHNSRTLNISIGLSVLIPAVIGVVLVSRHQR